MDTIVISTIVPIEEDYIIVHRGGTAYVRELGHGLKPPVSIHVSIWCVMDCPVQWGVVMEILGVLLALVNNDGRHESLPISSGKDK